MKSFKEFRLMKTKNESVVRSGAVSLYASQGKRHGDDAVVHFNRAKQRLRNKIDQRTIEKMVDDLSGAIEELLNGLISQRNQIGSMSAQITASTVIH